MNLKDLQISSQLRISLGAILVCIAALGLLAWWHIGILWQETGGLYNHPLQVSWTIGELRSNILNANRRMHDFVLAKTEDERKTALKDMAVNDAAAQRNFQVLYERYLGPREDIDHALNAFVAWKAIREESVRLLRNEKAENAAGKVRVAETTGILVEKLQVEINHIYDYSKMRANQYYQDAQHHKDDLQRQLVIIFCLILLLTAGIGYFLTRSVKEPLGKIKAAADNFRQGNQGVRSSYTSGNEFGTLSAAFNQMADTISIQMALSQINEEISETLMTANNLPELRRELLEKLAAVTDSQMGVYYLLDRKTNAFMPFRSIGADPGRIRPIDAAAFDGELGQVLLTKDIVHLKDMPDDTVFHFKTFTGTILPKEFLYFPLVVDNRVLGIAALASFKPYSEKSLAVLKQPWAILVHKVFTNMWADDEAKRLAVELRDTNTELELQKTELARQASELTEQNAELESQKKELIQQATELEGQNAMLENQKRQLDEANRLKSTFLSNMSHELRTPLNSVMALSRVLMMQSRAKLSSEEIVYLEIIERNGKHLLALINDILDLAKIEAGRMDINPRLFSVSSLLDNLIDSITPLADAKNLRILPDIPEDLPSLESDEVRVSQIIQNVMANAVKFTDTGEVTVSAGCDSQCLSIQIADTGIGIAEEELHYIFDEFRQVDGSSSRRHEGTGLGLAIAHKALRMLGGNITVKSIPGEGSVFHDHPAFDLGGGITC